MEIRREKSCRGRAKYGLSKNFSRRICRGLLKQGSVMIAHCTLSSNGGPIDLM